jgi:hypothetical protein
MSKKSAENGKRNIRKATMRASLLASKVVFGGLRQTAALFDGLPVSPSKLADRSLDGLEEDRRSRARHDATWSRIEQRRRVEGSSSTVFLSEELSLADWERQRQIEASLVPDPWWVPVAQKVRNVKLSSGVRTVEFGVQRAIRGWDESSTWNLGWSITAQLADQLDHLAAQANGWPASEQYPTFESWQRELHHQAAQLRRFNRSEAAAVALDRWWELTRAGAVETEIEKAWVELNGIEAEDVAAAKTAMRWVADNLELLWD